MSEAVFTFSGRAKFAGLGGMIQYFEVITDHSNRELDNPGCDKWDYILNLIEEHFTWIAPQPVGKSFLSSIQPGCIYEYFDIVTTDHQHVLSEQLGELFYELENRLPKNVIDDFALREIDSDAIRKEIHLFVGHLGKEDRFRINEDKLYWLVLFIYDYCNSFYRDALLSSSALRFIEDSISINGESFTLSKAEHFAIIDKLKTPCIWISEQGPDGKDYHNIEYQDYELTFQDGAYSIPHPKNCPQYKSIMFYDLLHCFFQSFGLKKRPYNGKPAQFNKYERVLIHNLLVELKFCNSKRTAKESKYVDFLSTCRDYLKDCDVLSWVRCNAYSYLIPVSSDTLYGDTFEQKDIQPESDLPLVTIPVYNDFFSDFCGYRVYSELVLGHPFKSIHSDNNFARMIETGDGIILSGIEDNPLEYVYSLLTKRFSFLQVLPMGPPTPIVKYDPTKREVFDVVERIIASDLLGREKEIVKNPLLMPRFSTTAEEIKNGLTDACRNELLGYDGERIEIDKLYYLVLFISDYCAQVFKDAELHPAYKRRHHKTIDVDGKKILTTIEVHDLVISYLKRPIKTYYGRKDCVVFGPRNGQLYTPPQEKRRHPQFDTKNYIAMFCDLFRSFLRSFGTIHREGAGLSDMDKRFIASILQTLGYKKASEGIISSYLAERRFYFRNCKLYDWLRVGPYSNLFLNDMDEELYASKDSNDDGNDCNECRAPQLAEN